MKKTSTRSISFVGSGNVATHFALALHQAGHRIVQVLSHSFDHAQLLAARVGAEPIDKPTLLAPTAEVYILATSDNSLYDLALDLRLPHALVLHTSGATPLTVLRPISRTCGVAWSPQTFVRDISIDYSRMPLCIEGSTPAAEQAIADLFVPITSHIHRLDFEQRRWAHLGSVMVSNFVNAINATAQELMEAHGISFDMLRPLAEQTLRKMDYGNLRAQQTGPAVRRDTHTLDAQRRLLANNPRLLDLYDQLTLLIQDPPTPPSA